MTCEHCGASIPTPERQGRPRRYCSRSCQNRAYRARHQDPIPAEMRAADRWMRYRLVPRAGKMTKVPTQTNGRMASSTASRTWTSHSTAKVSRVGEGLGFALGEGFGCIDLDDAIVDGRVQLWAQRILDRAPETFIEVSQSGKGLHIFGRLPAGRGRNLRGAGLSAEVYSTGRFIAVTGTPFEGSVPQLADLEDLVSSLL